MGLDNGIIIKNKNDTKKEEICYWRKCWNIRRLIFDCITPDNKEEWCSEFRLSLNDLMDIYYALKSLNKENWNDNGGSIWEWEEIKKGLKNDIKEINKLIKRMKRQPNLEIIFYDSY